MKIVLSVLVALTSIALIAVILLQSGKDAGLGAVAGNSDSYMNKNGGSTSKLAASTKWIALVWLLCVLGLSLI